MKKIIITEEEKNRILVMHNTRRIMSEQAAPVQQNFDKNYFNTNKTGTIVFDTSGPAYPTPTTINGKPTIISGEQSQTDLFSPYWLADFAGGRALAGYKGNGSFTYSYDGTNLKITADASNTLSTQKLPNGFMFIPK